MLNIGCVFRFFYIKIFGISKMYSRDFYVWEGIVSGLRVYSQMCYRSQDVQFGKNRNGHIDVQFYFRIDAMNMLMLRSIFYSMYTVLLPEYTIIYK